MVTKLLSFEFRIFRHFVTIFRNLVILRMSYLRNKMRFSKTFSYLRSSLSILTKKIAYLSAEDETELFFTVSLMTSFSRQKPSTSKNPKTYDCLEYKVLLSCKNSAQTVNNWKPSLNETTFWWQLTHRVQFPPLELLVGNSNRIQVLHQSYLASFLSRQKGNLPRN